MPDVPVRGIVFVGPSLPVETIREMDPSLLVLPPAAMGDLLSAVRHHQPNAVALIDGTFKQNLSVFHKEILWAMAEGVWVLGASSMGALRAAELHDLGMIGVGRIFDEYASGRLVDDDEVALAHADAEFGHQAVSTPMVNIRATLDHAVEQSILSQAQADALADAQKQRHFPIRNLRTLLDDAAALDLGLDEASSSALQTLIDGGGIDLKRQDAIAAVEQLSIRAAAPMPPDRRPARPVAATFQGTLERDVTVGLDDELPVTFDSIRRHSALNATHFERTWRAAVTTSILHRLAEVLGVVPSEQDHEHARAAVLARLTARDDRDSAATLRRLDMSDRDLERIVGDEAIALRFQRWLAAQAGYTRTTQAFIDQLRLDGRYEEARTEAGLFEQAASDAEGATTQPSLDRAIALHSALTGWESPSDLDRYIEDHQLGSRAELYDRLMVSLLAVQKLTGLPVPMVSESPSVESGPIATRGHQG